ncbi:hypothetical protein GALMADRAFT_1031158 [Galerina marginata CBS 339.88]|uniref:Phytocyanin domain-containing protein n=1 Tax=Galerina marginata (strain CBS 339.88) TaxID=685588 RepID=A0A067SCZ5_GALM3|nr:hypothetical protein GALMADRAFT_1031158 [Galerina marginata CBS 339.88]
MYFSVVVIAIALLYADPANAVDHLILVGGNGALAFDPPDITAAAGDTIVFEFQGNNHSVTQSTFANPCTRQIRPSLGISSGFMPVAAGTTALPQWLINVDDVTVPLWFFCAQISPVSHCNQGMVLSVNAPAGQTFVQFQESFPYTLLGLRPSNPNNRQ